MAAISTLGAVIFSRSTTIDPARVGFVEVLNYPGGKELISFIEKTYGTSSIETKLLP